MLNPRRDADEPSTSARCGCGSDEHRAAKTMIATHHQRMPSSTLMDIAGTARQGGGDIGRGHQVCIRQHLGECHRRNTECGEIKLATKLHRSARP